MPWSWQLPTWPKFIYQAEAIRQQEQRFLLRLGSSIAHLDSISSREQLLFAVEILSQEGLESSKIEGELLDRESLQSSIKRHFGLKSTMQKGKEREAGMATLLCDINQSFNLPLTHEILWKWHELLFADDRYTNIEEQGCYRTHSEPMQIVSHRYNNPRVYFEAPPSKEISKEMNTYLKWFNHPIASESILGRAAIAHVYFESIHPFEDGNGRIGRALIEKTFSQYLGRPVLIAVSRVLEKRNKEYYAALERCNSSLDAQYWVEFFADAMLQAQADSTQLLKFIVKKSKMMSSLSGKINDRQEKAILKMFESGPEGFKGGLSAENYIAITKTSRATATRDLNELVNLEVLKKTGELKHTRYWLN